MAWAEKTFFNIEDPPQDKSSESEKRINRLLKDLPPFMKLNSRKARKVLVRYEELKERHIENLRNNQVFKFVMKVAGFTNERIEKFWKGSDISPFMERYTPQNIKITKEDLDILLVRAREHALSDLHQFCTELAAIPTYRPIQRGKGVIDRDESVNIPDHSALPDPNGGVGTNMFSSKKFIFNMTDAEFQVFCKKFLLMKKSLDKAYDGRNGRNDIEWYLLTDDTYPPVYDKSVYDHTKYFDQDEKQVESYDEVEHEGKSIYRSAYWTWIDSKPLIHWDKTTAEFWFQRYIAKWLAGDIISRDEKAINDRFKDLPEFRAKYTDVYNNLRLDKSTGKWMRDLTGLRLTKMIRGRSKFKDRKIGYDPNENGPPQLRRSESAQQRASRVPVGVTGFEAAEEEEGGLDMERPQDMPTEVPLDFVRPIFNERFTYWKHELVLGEYEKRSMQEADKWLQMTPWAIGKIYLQPSIYAHMQEAHIAITKKWKKFQHMTLEDWLNSEEHAFFFSKLVALCIKTSDILSGKKYGLDKMYMRINLEKRRVMYSIGKLDAPSRKRRGMSTLPPTASQERLLRDWAVARERGDAEAAAAIQASMQRAPF